MAYCKECGAYIADGLTECPACGKKVGGKKRDRENAWDIYEDNGYRGGERAYRQRCNDQNRKTEYEAPRKESGRTYTGTVIDTGLTTEARLLAACSYLGWLVFLPLLMRRDDPYVRFHLNQGLVLFLMGFLHIFVGGLLDALIGTAIMIMCIGGIVYAITGREKQLPFIGDIHILK
ncbi:MAG: hypothetical protein ACOX81_10760 [Candidatus Heteroscillospira sp.]|jgi:uncharacterized membrane protein